MSSQVNLLETLIAERNAFRSASARNSGVSTVKARLMNVMFNHLDEIIQSLSETDNLKNKIQTLTNTLNEADEEYRDLNQRYKELLNAHSGSKKSKGSAQGG